MFRFEIENQRDNAEQRKRETQENIQIKITHRIITGNKRLWKKN